MDLGFFAARSDFASVLEIVLGEKSLRLIEAYSRYDEPCREFRDVASVGRAFPRFARLHLMAWDPATCRMTRKRITLDPKACEGHTFRYSAEGWGLIQILGGTVHRESITPSRIAHNSAARAAKWGAREKLDFVTINRISGRIARAVKKLAVARASVPGETRGGRLVLPEAARLARTGRALKQAPAAPWSYTLTT